MGLYLMSDLSMEEPFVLLTSSGRTWPIAVCAVQQIIYWTLLIPTGSYGTHYSPSKFECLYQI